MIRLVIIFIIALPELVSAGIIGTVGLTYPFAERDALSEVEESAKQVNWKKILAEAKVQARRYKPKITVIPRAAAARKRQVDMSYTLDVDVPDPRDPSRVMYPRGYTFNPLQYMQIPGCVVFVNAGDRPQREWLIKKQAGRDLQTPIVLTGGDLESVQKAMKRPVFFADALLLERFGIEAVPAVACQNGAFLEVEEFEIEKDHR